MLGAKAAPMWELYIVSRCRERKVTASLPWPVSSLFSLHPNYFATSIRSIGRMKVSYLKTPVVTLGTDVPIPRVVACGK